MSKAWDKAKKVIGSVAPILGTAIGGPWGAVATSVIGSVLGVDPNDEKAVAALAADPAKLLELKKAEIEFKRQLEELGVKEQEIYLSDRQSARELAKTDMRAQWTLSGVVVAGFFACLYALFFADIPAEGFQREALLLLLGVLTQQFVSVMSFWFGSSQGSKEKTLMIDAGKVK